MKVQREEVKQPKLGMKVYHDKIYNGKELMEVVGIRKHEVELYGDYSGGVSHLREKDWYMIEGLFRTRKVCEQVEKYGTCQLHNIHCAYPDCEPYLDKQPNKEQ